MNSSETAEEPTPKQLKEESMAIFMAGQIMGCKLRDNVKTRGQYRRSSELMSLMSKINMPALIAFYRSPRSDPKQGSDFRYRRQIGTLIKDHKAIFKNL